MQKVFDEVNSLDKRCYEEYALNEDILMEHAANSMYQFIKNKFSSNITILIVCGSGNNGADGITLGRLLYKQFNVKLYIPFEVKSKMAKLQLKRVKLLGVDIVSKVTEVDLIVDCLYGSGLTRDFDEKTNKIIEKLNKTDGYKLSCDIPSGLNNNGSINTTIFKADTTITMGALKKNLFNDNVKNYVGDIIVANLGVQREVYESNTNTYLLDKEDLKLPIRDDKNTHKGSFGHLCVIVGDKKGAGVLCADSGFHFGAGLVSIISHSNFDIPYHIMHSHKIPNNTTAIALGMGLGNYEQKEIVKILKSKTAKVIDADLFYSLDILEILNQKNVVLTPHPKEFCSLLKLLEIEDVDIKTLQDNRFKYVELFCKKYPNIVLLLKGSNVLIGKEGKIYINNNGSAKLSFGGSGDILAGLIASLLAQGYNSLDSAICGSLAHTLAASNYNGNDYSLTPIDLIEQIKYLNKTTIKKI
ncbi:MAG: NAD(P)H-hydrate dehydratase [Campylobacterota bacterium]|nr:NAD(P)H-hydrate dehydratase [Campylobacterota bacterium]